MYGLLQELVTLMPKASVESKRFTINYQRNKSLQERLLYQMINSRELDEDRLSIELGYEGKNSKPYLVLRKLVFDKVIQMILFLKPEVYTKSHYLTEYYNCQRDLFVAKILANSGFIRTAERLFKVAFQSAKQIEVWDVAISASNSLTDLYSVSGKVNESKFYHQQATETIVKLQMERELHWCLNEMNLYFTQATVPKSEIIYELEKYLALAEEYDRYDDVFNIRFLHFRLRIIYLQVISEYRKAIEVCDRALVFLDKFPSMDISLRQGMFLGTKMHCYMNLRDFEMARSFAVQSKKYFDIGTRNWYTLNENYFIVSIQTFNYSTAWEVLQEAVGHSKFTLLATANKEKWLILQAYMELIIMAGIWKPQRDATGKKFNIHRFLNDVPVFQKDKEGVNVSILVLQVIYFIIQGDYPKVISLEDSLRRYITRYLHTKSNERSRLFLTMLTKVIALNFNYLVIEESVKRLLHRLKKEKFNYSANMGGSEIVDYEVLWQCVLDWLRINFASLGKIQ